MFFLFGFCLKNKELFVLEFEEKVAILTSDKAKLQLTIQEKEHNLLTSVQAAREDEWKKISEITNEKYDLILLLTLRFLFFAFRLNLEAECNILKKSDEKHKQLEMDCDRFREKIQSLERNCAELRKENDNLSAKMRQTNDCHNELEQEQEKTRELYKKCVKLESQLASTGGIEV